MEPNFWRDRWQEGKIGFHEGKPNSFLEKHVAMLGERARVFVPLCGKTEDLAFLAKTGHQVVGIELVESALRDFFKEHSLEPDVTKDDRFVTFRKDAYTLFAGDYFALHATDLGPATAAYDRAAIVAMPPDLRARYVDHLRVILPRGARILTVTFEYDESKFSGPPFSVSEKNLRELYAGATIEPIDQAPYTRPSPLLDANAGVQEKCWLVTI